jgi:adenosine deaminase
VAERRQDGGVMDFNEFLTRLPKVDIHCHLVGTLRPTTLGELARKHQVPLPRSDESLYDFEDFYAFIDALRLSATVMRDQADFARVAFEALEDGFRAGNMRHAELMFNPQYFYPNAVTYRTMVDGLIEGIRAAERDFGISALLIAAIDRQIDPSTALEILDHVLAYRRDDVVGIGLDGPERAGPPESFYELYHRAGAAGLLRTAHVCEDNQTLAEAPPRNFAVCCDVLNCDRLDHGYNLLADKAMVTRARDEGLFFNTCAITSVRKNLERRAASIAQMVEVGLPVTLNTDDPAMFKTDVGHTYRTLFARLGWGCERARDLSLAGVDACWLDSSARADLRRAFEREITALEQELS